MKRGWKMRLCLLVAVVLLVMTGCQAIGGVDLNKALLNSMEVQSMEGSGTVELELIADEAFWKDEYSGEEMALMKLFKNVKLSLDSIKMESKEKMSLKGALEISKGKIPFEVSMTPEQLVFKPEGAVKPFVMDLTGMEQGTNEKLTALVAELQTKLQNPDVVRPLYSYLVNGLPNPKSIKLDNVQETINGQSVSLYKVSAELKGNELLDWIRRYILALMQDDKGMKEAIAKLYDALEPTIRGMVEESKANLDRLGMGGIGEMDSDAEVDIIDEYVYGEMQDEYDMGDTGLLGLYNSVPFLGSIGSLLDDRETAIEFIHTELKQVMVFVLVGLEEAKKQDDGSMSQVLNDKTSIKSSIYVDSGLKIRKSETEFTLAPTLEESVGLQAVKVKSSFSSWKINEPVKADVLSGEGGFAVEEIGEPMSMLRNIDKSSLLYQVLRDDLKLTRKMVFFNLSYAEFMHPSMRPYKENNVTMVPVRYFGEQLGAKVEWDPIQEVVTLTDEVGGTVIILPLDSKEAKVNGKKVELEMPAVERDGSVYVPLRFAAESLGGKVEWNEELELITVTIER